MNEQEVIMWGALADGTSEGVMIGEAGERWATA